MTHTHTHIYIYIYITYTYMYSSAYIQIRCGLVYSPFFDLPITGRRMWSATIHRSAHVTWRRTWGEIREQNGAFEWESHWHQLTGREWMGCWGLLGLWHWELASGSFPKIPYIKRTSKSMRDFPLPCLITRGYSLDSLTVTLGVSNY